VRRAALAAGVLAAVLLSPQAAGAKLVFERENGTAIRSSATPIVWCGPWSPEVTTPALHVAVPRRGKRFFWSLSAVRRDLVRGKAFTFPHSFTFDEPSDALLFAVDGENELSTAEEESRGRVFYRRISCRPGALVSFRIDARLGSELFAFATISVSGTFRGRVGTRTAPIH
jgi:hypothetical protein